LYFKGIVRIENVDVPQDFVDGVLRRVKPEYTNYLVLFCSQTSFPYLIRYIAKTYGLKQWKNTHDFLDQLSQKTGKLLKGGEPDLYNSAVRVLRDWQRGRLPYFVQPPDTEDYLASVS